MADSNQHQKQRNHLHQKANKKRPSVHKFGGSSLKNVQSVQQVINRIVEQANPGDFVVVSANGKMTDLLFKLINGEPDAASTISNYICQLVTDLLGESHELLPTIKRDLVDIKALNNIENMNCLLAYGELWSAQILSACLAQQSHQADWLDARHLFRINDHDHSIDHQRLNNSLAQLISKNPAAYHVITGYIATNQTGKTITLGRNGSDYTATLVAEAIHADEVNLWTDVDGIFTADPNVLEEAQKIEQLSLCEAQALSELGSNVLHQQTISPLLNNRTEIIIRQTQKKHKGTTITREQVAEQQVKTITSKHDLTLFNITHLTEWQAKKFQTALVAQHIYSYTNRYDKTQHELHFCVATSDAFVVNQLAKNHNLNLLQKANKQSLISLVGQNIRQSPHILTTLLQRTSHFNITNIYYPANEHTLCILLPQLHSKALLRDLHQTFFSLAPSLPIIILGYGNIGQAFIQLLKRNQSAIEQQINQSLSLWAVATSKQCHVDRNGLLSGEIKLKPKGSVSDNLAQLLDDLSGKAAVVIDLTASEIIAQHYPDWASAQWHIISANKVAAADKTLSQQTQNEINKSHRLWLKNTTVGAALPVQSSIQGLRETGDRIQCISGVFSGSLSWLMGHYKGEGFTALVKQAKEQGFSEPDPRDDLSGQDVYRKALILAQEAGFNPQDIHFKPLLPKKYLTGDLNDFWSQNEAIDQYIHQLWQQAQDDDKTLCYLANITADEIHISLQALPACHPAAQIQPSDNVFVIESQNYSNNPLVIQGPGAGREVTAAGVLNDLLKVLKA
ncbi:bifunctional aspartate kinase/homoserine dehydrogenase II [Marinicella rhabdoformis]|uniref:bifunctional aspartate kinase/homoserine dehydrogenase II n=1 Tax=Marinicella rhabdoformis TaxID=2580566 RepID=UPI0012AEB86B|nr:bifunctional aspartate kinase/homoserine dehydrogenase II [Marinicella rhabdoformis]